MKGVCAALPLAALSLPVMAGHDPGGGPGSLPEIPPQPVIHLISESGTAPFTVHVHALDSQTGTGSPLTARYEWDFGDAEGRYDRLEGFVAAHTYDQPGQYQLRLSLTNDSGFRREAEVGITVRCFEGESLYVAADGDDDNEGTSPDAPLKTAAKGFELLAENMRLQFRRGDVFDIADSGLVGHSRAQVGAFGEGPRPVLRWIGPTGYYGIIMVSDPQAREVLIEGLTFDSIYDVSALQDVVDGVVPDGRNVTIRDCQFKSVSLAINANRSPQGLLVMDNVAGVLGGYFGWSEGEDHCYIGNTVAGSHWQHNIRLGGAERLLIARNRLTNYPKRTIWAMLGQHCYIAGNEINTGRVSIGPDSAGGGPEDAYRWVVMERNLVSSESGADAAVELLPGAEHVQLRNNIIRCDGSTCIHIGGFDEQTQRTNRHVGVVSNTGINSSTVGRFLDVGEGSVGLDLISNLYAAEQLITGSERTANVYVDAEDLRSFRTVHHNVWARPADYSWVPGACHYVYPYWSNAEGYKTAQGWESYGEVRNEGYETARLGEDFAPGPSSIAATFGVAANGVFDDYYGSWRPAGSCSAGAVEVDPQQGVKNADLNADGVVDILDLFAVMEAWGYCPDPPEECPADISGDGRVDFEDILLVLMNWT